MILNHINITLKYIKIYSPKSYYKLNIAHTNTWNTDTELKNEEPDFFGQCVIFR